MSPQIFPFSVRLSTCGAVFPLFILLAVPAAGRSNIRSAFFAAYPSAIGSPIDTVPSAPVHCGVCHYSFSGGGARNPYGVRVEQALPGFPNTNDGRRMAILSIQNIDADLDGYSTLTEVLDTVNYGNTPTFPGLNAANASNATNVNVAEIIPYLTPTPAADTSPPDVTVLSPNGGETFTANSAASVTWTASDVSGVVYVNLYISIDGGPFHLVSFGLANDGTAPWFPANRPTATARFRVEAFDGAGNAGFDDSDAFFWIVSPAGGLAPTTLRDFDQPGTQPFEATINDPSNCINCHGFYNPAVEPYFNWSGSMMAQASRDPLFEACMAVGNQDAPDSGDLCLRCHVPAAWLMGRSVPTSGEQVQPSDRHGVSCDLCHRLVDPIYEPENPPEDQDILADLMLPPTTFGNGMYVVDPTGTRRGPFADAAIAHPILVSPFHREAALCGTCHDVSNPAFERDASGNYIPNAFNAPATSFSAHTLLPIERTYSEWLNSQYNTPQGVYAPQFGGNRTYVASCQDCHMRAVTGPGCIFPDAPIRNDLPLHDMTGGSTWLPPLLAALYPDEVAPAAAQAAVIRARYMLQNAADLSITQDGEELLVTVTNNTGHKLPTGYPEGRRIWINVRFLDSEGALVAESGAYEEASGTLINDSQIMIYEAKPGLDEITAPLVGTAPGPSFHFVLNNKVFKDNRIPPRGFTNAAFAAFGGAPVGATYEDGQYWDVATYNVPATADRVEVRLYYQSTSKEFIEFLRDENTTNNAGQELYNLWVSNNRCPPELMQFAELELTPPLAAGDMNCDGIVTPGDIAGFVLALTDPAAYAVQFPNCDVNNADVNGDGVVSPGDIAGFVALLIG